jgi:hypothetical protein
MEQQAMRQLAIEVMTGRKPLPMEVKAWPIDSSMAAQQRDTQAEAPARAVFRKNPRDGFCNTCRSGMALTHGFSIFATFRCRSSISQ